MPAHEPIASSVEFLSYGLGGVFIVGLIWILKRFIERDGWGDRLVAAREKEIESRDKLNIRLGDNFDNLSQNFSTQTHCVSSVDQNLDSVRRAMKEETRLMRIQAAAIAQDETQKREMLEGIDRIEHALGND